jgi:hypothetical protein
MIPVPVIHRKSDLTDYTIAEPSNLLGDKGRALATWAIIARSSVVLDTTHPSPDGSRTSYKFTEDTTPTNIHYLREYVTLDDNTIYSFTIYVCAGTKKRIALESLNKAGVEGYVLFDIPSSSVLSSTGSSIYGSSIRYVGGGWYKIQMLFNSSNGATNPLVFVVGCSSTNASVKYTGDGVSALYLWGAQVIEGAT